MRRLFLTLIVLILPLTSTFSQIVTTGTDPGSLRWRYILTEDYKVIFPEGLDSLARVYAASLEQVKIPVSGHIGYIPNQNYRRQMPVVLHPFTAQSNGMVAWTPRQMHLYTTPESFRGQPLPWVEQLTVHESRHVAQMQYVRDRAFRPLHYISGELFAGAAAALWCGPAFFEGDAVLAETELSASGRGRSGGFLEYQRACFLQGDKRDYWRWRYGSQTLYTPDYYRVGYLTMAGMRTVFDEPDFTHRYFERLFKGWWPFPFFVWQKTVRDVSGLKFKDAFAAIVDSQTEQWRTEADARGPFQSRRQVIPTPRLYEASYGSVYMDGRLWSLRAGLERPCELVATSSDGEVENLGLISSTVSHLNSDGGRLYWCETIQDPRWEMRSSSDLFCFEDGRRHRLTRGGRYYNPAAHSDVVALTCFPVEGGSATVLLDAATGKRLHSCPAPDSLQLAENVWVGDRLYVSATSAAGTGIYESGTWKAVLPPSRCFISELFSHEGKIFFTSDLGGVNELYSLDPEGGKTLRHTNNLIGAESFRFHSTGDTLFFSSTDRGGKLLWSTPADSLPVSPADFSKPFSYAMADKLSAAKENSIEDFPSPDVQESQPYSKLLNAVRFHSWFPLYVDVDAISRLTLETITSSAGIGAMGLFQNELGTLSGTIGYYPSKLSYGWIHTGEVKFTYRGAYPVIEGGFSISSAYPDKYMVKYGHSWWNNYCKLDSNPIFKIPALSGSLKVYIPFNFSSGGLKRGVVPQIQLSASNSIVWNGFPVPLNRASVSLRGYVMQGIPSSCIYPRWGIGMEAGVSSRLGIDNILSPNMYAYAYGYVPGIIRTHGIRLSAKYQHHLGNALFMENFTDMAPRGFSSCAGITTLFAKYPNQALLTFDYAFPFASLDWSGMGPVAYVRNLEMKLHADCSALGGSANLPDSGLASLGASLSVHLGNLLWLPYATRIGVSCSWNGGPGFDSLNDYGLKARHIHIGAIFSVDL